MSLVKKLFLSAAMGLMGCESGVIYNHVDNATLPPPLVIEKPSSKTQISKPIPMNDVRSVKILSVEELRRREFDRIRANYVEHLHDCDDMVQEYRDYLLAHGVALGDMKLFCAADKTDESKSHFWMLLYKINGERRLYDPAMNLYDENPDYHAVKYKQPVTYESDFILNDGTGYSRSGDRFEGNKWVNDTPAPTAHANK